MSRENHKAIRNERFHRYLNKVQRINTADTGSLFRWKQGVIFSVYAWNASPMNGTDICQSLVAIARDFPFPIDIESTVMRGCNQESHNALDYYDAASPLLYRQRYIAPTMSSKNFSIAQVSLHETNPLQAKTSGIYKMRLWTQTYQDKNIRSLSQSRFYPALQSIHQTTNKYHPTRPDKVQQVLANDPTLVCHFSMFHFQTYALLGHLTSLNNA